MKSVAISATILAAGACLAGCSERQTPEAARHQATVSPPSTSASSDRAPATTPPPTDLLTALQRASLKPEALKPVLKRPWGSMWGFEVRASKAEEIWSQYRSATGITGHYPLLISAREDNVIYDSPLEHAESPQQIIASAIKIDASLWLAERADGALRDGEKRLAADFDKDNSTVVDPDRFVCLEKAFPQEHPWYLVLVPTTNPWEVFAFLDYGGWNAYPFPAWHVAVMKHWFETCGAEPVIVTDDCIEMIVQRPPQSETTCRELALEQFGYTAGDLVNQGYGHFGTLARVLRGRRHWFFWWD